MIGESEVLARLRRIAAEPEARGLLDDVALLDGLVLTHDTIAEGVHFLSFDPPSSVGWKLVTVNLSDLAAKGATPRGALLSLTMSGTGRWEDEFLTGVEAACESYGLPLVGGDTIALPDGAPRVLGMTAIGTAGERTPGRDGGCAGDSLWLIGSVGEAAAGLEQLRKDKAATGPLVDIYRRPIPQLEAGKAVAPHAHAMMDVSDGLLLDARRMAEASGCSIRIDLGEVPLTSAFKAARGERLEDRLFAATGGDDYALLAALPSDTDLSTFSLPEGTSMARIGSLSNGPPQLELTFAGETIKAPERLGFEHSSDHTAGLSASPLADRH